MTMCPDCGKEFEENKPCAYCGHLWYVEGAPVVDFGDDINGAAAEAGHDLSTPQSGYFDGTGYVTNSVEGCEHEWAEVECEPPYDVCTSCGAKRE